MFKRLIEEKLIKRKNGSRKPLIVSGLRQVGKTTTILEFCRKNYENVIYIDFRSDQTFSKIFKSDFDINRITSLISTKIENAHFIPGKTIIFFDEIQECAKARASLKYFYLDHRYDIICSGSLLGIKNYNQDFSRSVSVGFETFLTMYPMNFEEFLLALKKDSLLPYIKDSISQKKEIDDFVHQQLLELFQQYLVIGGMPEIVSRFIQTHNFDEIFSYQKDLVNTYINDFGRNINAQNIVTRDNKLFERILLVYKSIPNQLAKENNKFQYSSIINHGRASTFYDAIEWLVGAGLAYKINNLKTVETPLSFFQIEDQFKLYFADIALVLPSYGKIAQEMLLIGNSGVYKGAIYENAICSLLKINEISFSYYQKPNRLEVDFVVETPKRPIIIEVKATNAKSKSLSTIASDPKAYGDPNLKCIKFYDKNLSYSNDKKILNLPYYMVDFIDFNTIFED